MRLIVTMRVNFEKIVNNNYRLTVTVLCYYFCSTFVTGNSCAPIIHNPYIKHLHPNAYLQIT